jgi:hypothetical protein
MIKLRGEMSDSKRPQKMKTISQKTKGMKKYPGFYTFFWDEKAGKIWLEIDRFNEEFLYVISSTTGLGSNDIGLDRNQLGSTKVVEFNRVGPKVLLIQKNWQYRAVSESAPERIAVEDAFAKSVIWGFEVGAEEKKSVLVDATEFLLRDAKMITVTLKKREAGEYKIDASRCAIYTPRTKNFPNNTEFESWVTYTGDKPGQWIEAVAPDPYSLSLRQHHSFVKLPEPGYKPRLHDPRCSYITTSWNDYSTPTDQPLMKRYITRHRLEKKNKNSKISPAVKPIIYYVDNAVPEPIRSALVEGASWWNQAFEAAGYKDAFQVKIFSEDADPMDIRYNVINWVHRQTRGWSYGQMVRDPRTGENLKGHVSIGSDRIRQDYMIALGLVGDYTGEPGDSKPMLEMALARIRQLSAHEVGHAIGLGHNYAASINNRASVMDYPPPTIKIENGSIDLRDAYDTGIGEWDKVAICYGYQDFPNNIDEKNALNEILTKAFKSGLWYLADPDARYGSAHPLAASWDSGVNPIDELEHIINVREIALRNFDERKVRVGDSMATLEEPLVLVYLIHRYQVEAVASVLGGIYYNHTVRGDVQKNPVLVSPEEVKRGLKVLLKTLDPEFLAFPEKIRTLLPPRHPSYAEHRDLFQGRTGLPFDSLAAVEQSATITIESILHPERAARMVEYHAYEPQLPTLSDIIDVLIENTWKKQYENAYHAEIQRTVNNVLLYRLMSLASDEKVSTSIHGVSYAKLEELRLWLNDRIHDVKDSSQKAHYLYGVKQIKVFQKDPTKIKITQPLNPPMGPPL